MFPAGAAGPILYEFKDEYHPSFHPLALSNIPPSFYNYIYKLKPAILLMTATPMLNKNDDLLFNLFNK